MFTRIDGTSAVLHGWIRFLLLAVYATLGVSGRAQSTLSSSDSIETLTNAAQVRRFASLQKTSRCYVRLDGLVLWVSPARDRLILQDDSGGLAVKLDLHNQAEVRAGQETLIEGDCLADHKGVAFELLINDDGIHAPAEKSGAIFLSAGLHPISVEWFNGPAGFDLELDCQSPQESRQRVTEAALFRTDSGLAGGTNQWSHGLDFRCYEGEWAQLPDFSQLPVTKMGAATNFDLGVRTRDLNVGLVFSGYFRAPRDGEYRFWLRSDDGSKLYISDHPPLLKVLRSGMLPSPRRISPGRLIPENQELQWSEMEGTVTRVSNEYEGVSMELMSGTGRGYLRVMGEHYESLRLLLHGRVRAEGICQNACDINGQTAPSLLAPSLREITTVEMPSQYWVDNPVLPIRALIETNEAATTGAIVHLKGVVSSNAPAGFLAMEDKTARILVETSLTAPRIGTPVEALGWWSREGDKVVLRNGLVREISEDVKANPGKLPLLTQAMQVKSLSRAEAERGYPVRIQGMITARIGSSFVIQDLTRPVFIQWGAVGATESPEIGDYWEINGKTFMDFAPNVRVSRATYLRPGVLPEPLRPTINELISGSLDTQYIELQGVVAAVEAPNLTLLTREGKATLLLQGLKPDALKDLEGAVVRVRGVNSPSRDEAHRMLAPLMLFSASISVDEPGPRNPFETPLKHASDLLLFDVRADALRRIKVAGQILHESREEHYLMDGSNGLRFEPKLSIPLQVGDLVEVVGFPDISGTSPVLREAQVRVVGQTNLPAPQRLSEDKVLNGKADATMVSVKSRLIDLGADDSDQILEMQTGSGNFIARLAKDHGALAGILPGSLLDLTGVYKGHGGDRASGRDIDSFELLLNSPSDLRVLERPSWWTFRHALIVIGGMILVIVAALVWIALLRRQVEERSSQLTSEIKGRQQAEHQRALEEERARIASDLHDELGATLTEIRLLGAMGSRDASLPSATRSKLMKVSDKSHEMVSLLDEIVWAINPANDSLPNLANYLCHVTNEFFRATQVRCRLDMDELLPQVALIPEVRHNLYLVVREALNNVVKHSKATEAWLRFHWKDRTLDIIIEDNGCGFNGVEVASGNGLLNMRRRLEKIGGHFEINSRPQAGTICRIWLSFT
jgi:signal transduction histidine kinase